MPTASEYYQMCISGVNPGDPSYADSQAACLAAARMTDPNFNPTIANGGSGGFWSNPMNYVNLASGAGTAVGTWFDAFGVQFGQGAQNNYTPPPAGTNDQKPSMTWLWVLLGVLLLIGLFILIYFLKK